MIVTLIARSVPTITTERYARKCSREPSSVSHVQPFALSYAYASLPPVPPARQEVVSPDPAADEHALPRPGQPVRLRCSWPPRVAFACAGTEGMYPRPCRRHAARTMRWVARRGALASPLQTPTERCLARVRPMQGSSALVGHRRTQAGSQNLLDIEYPRSTAARHRAARRQHDRHPHSDRRRYIPSCRAQFARAS
jgi:hypothetical protein